ASAEWPVHPAVLIAQAYQTGRTVLSAGVTARDRTCRSRSDFMAGHPGSSGPRSGTAVARLLRADAPRTEFSRARAPPDARAQDRAVNAPAPPVAELPSAL